MILVEDKRIGNSPFDTWVPEDVSLMLVPPEVRDCVSFICRRKSVGGEPTPAGTAFLVIVPIPGSDLGHCYFVTARHVVEKAQKDGVDEFCYWRMNSVGGGFRYARRSWDMWHFHPTDKSVDVAVAEWCPPKEYDFNCFPMQSFATTEVIAKSGIGHGDEVFVVGLFTQHSGKKRNIPIIRIGNIAAMNDEPIECKWANGPMDAYLIEARSIGGLSGSPVFAHLGMGMTPLGQRAPGTFYLLGLIHGHWNIPPEPMMDIAIDDADRFDLVNTGIAIVVPATKVIEVIDQPFFQKRREEDYEKIAQERRDLVVPD